MELFQNMIFEEEGSNTTHNIRVAGRLLGNVYVRFAGSGQTDGLVEKVCFGRKKNFVIPANPRGCGEQSRNPSCPTKSKMDSRFRGSDSFESAQ